MDIQFWEKYIPSSHDVKSELQRYIYKRAEEAFDVGDASRDAIHSIEELKNRQTKLRNSFIDSIGGLPTFDTDLKPKVLGSLECEGFRIEKVVYQSRPDTYVTSNLYIPNGVTSPRGAVLFLSGHSAEAKHAILYQNVCRYLVNAGLIVLSQDPIGQGERFSYYEKSLNAATISGGTAEHDYVGSQCLPLGDSLARYFVHDSMRSIDYLCTRPEVDPTKIGVTGCSGGGTQTSMMMICDPRIAAAAPAAFIMNRKTYMYAGGNQDAEQIWPKFTAMGFDHEDILLAMAPRPVRVLACTFDFFPIEGARLSVERTKRFWEMFGKSDCFDLTEDETVHHYSNNMAISASEFFSLHLLGKKITPDKNKIKTTLPSAQWCTKSGQVRGEIEGARAVHEENIDRLAEYEKARKLMPKSQQKERAINWLKDKVFANRISVDLNLKCFITDLSGDLFFESKLWWSQEGVHGHALSIRDYRFSGMCLPITLAIWDSGTNNLQSHINWIRKTCESGRAIVVLDTTGVGSLEPNTRSNYEVHGRNGALHSFVNELIWLDDSLAAIRVFDVIRSLDALESWKGLDNKDIQLYAHGKQGFYGQLASCLDSRIKSVESVNGMGNYADWVKARYYDNWDIQSIIIPGLLKYMDISDINGWEKENN